MQAVCFSFKNNHVLLECDFINQNFFFFLPHRGFFFYAGLVELVFQEIFAFSLTPPQDNFSHVFLCLQNICRYFIKLQISFTNHYMYSLGEKTLKSKLEMNCQ